MTTKLVSANMGIILVVEQDGKEKTVQFSVTCPEGINQPTTMVAHLCDFLNENLGMDIFVDWHDLDKSVVQIAKPKRIKAHRNISQNEFNKKIKELGYKP